MLLQNQNHSYSSGIIAESIAKILLNFKGYQILESRFKVGRGISAGEIDIIAKKGSCLIFIEVKKRKTLDLAKEAIFQKQINRIIKSAEFFIAKNEQYHNFDCRFDAICFDEFYRCEHIKNAWIS